MNGFTKGRALVVGIADYAHTLPLPDTVRQDAIDIAGVLSSPDISAYDPGAVRVLTDRNATSTAIRNELRQAAMAADSDEVFVFFFSGHGARLPGGTDEASLLATHETDPADLVNTALMDSELLALLQAIPSERQVIIIDACHSGGVGVLKGPGGAASLPASPNFNALAKGRGRVVLCSSRSDEISFAPYSMSNSLFTAVVLDGLRGAAADRGDGTIGVFDLFNYVAAEVPKLAAQHPVFKADGLEENFAIALRPALKSPTPAAKAAPVPPPEQVEALLCALYPLGPMHDQIWQRAGGDASRLQLAGTGVAQWHAALRMISLGGGTLTLAKLLDAAANDYPLNQTLATLRASA